MRHLLPKLRTIRLLAPILLAGSALLLAACQPLREPPRLALQTAQAEAGPTPMPERLVLPAPTMTRGGSVATAQPSADIERQPAEQNLTVWINEASDEHRAAVAEIAAAFAAATGYTVEQVLVSPRLLPDLVRTAALSGTLPAVVMHPLEYSAGWAEDGILDPAAADAVVDLLGRETFDPQALDMLTLADGALAAVPVDGWHQLIVYRRDWFEARGLAVPNTYTNLIRAAEALADPERNIAGLVVPTDSLLASTQQVFEQIAAAGGCELIDAAGEVTLLHPACLEALEYYRQLVNDFSPVGVQTDASALRAYLAGRTGIIMASPAVLPALAGLDAEYVPLCPECDEPDFLTRNSGYLTTLTGSGDFAAAAAFGETINLGLTGHGNREAAIAFASFWLNEGYPQWLAVNPERKVPLRWGTPADPRRFLDGWPGSRLTQDGPTLDSLLDEAAIEAMTTGISAGRWAFEERHGALLTSLYEELTLSPLLQDMLSGYFTSSQTIVEMYKAVVDLVPGYPFPIDLAETPTPEA